MLRTKPTWPGRFFWFRKSISIEFCTVRRRTPAPMSGRPVRQLGAASGSKFFTGSSTGRFSRPAVSRGTGLWAVNWDFSLSARTTIFLRFRNLFYRSTGSHNLRAASSTLIYMVDRDCDLTSIWGFLTPAGRRWLNFPISTNSNLERRSEYPQPDDRPWAGSDYLIAKTIFYSKPSNLEACKKKSSSTPVIKLSNHVTG